MSKHRRSLSSYLLLIHSSVSVVRGVLRLHPRVLGFSRECLVLRWLLIVLIVMGNGVSNHLCHQLVDATPRFCILIKCSQLDWIRS